MIGHWLPRLIDKALNDKKLRVVDKREVQLTAVFLLQGMFRHHPTRLRAQAKQAWVDDFFLDIAKPLDVPTDRLADQGDPSSLAELELADIGGFTRKSACGKSVCLPQSPRHRRGKGTRPKEALVAVLVAATSVR